METLISSLNKQIAFSVTHASDVSAARRAGQQMADDMGFDETRAGQLAIIITEAATNIVKHGIAGKLFVGPSTTNQPGIDVIAFDTGPGMGDVDLCLRDGVSSAGTAGNGLGALMRLSDAFDIYSARDKGTALFMRLFLNASESTPAGRLDIGALSLPLIGEDETGDAWAVSVDEEGANLVGVDGLGHGPIAAEAALAAIQSVEASPSAEPARILENAHKVMRATRGAAMAAARIDFARNEVRFAGIGNIAASVYDDEGVRRQLVSHNGIVGNNMRKVQEFTAPCSDGALCILHSDGLSTQWSLESYPGLQGRHPALIAAVLLRDFARVRDDAMVLVVRRLGAYS
ncbi:MAG: SpoIIE family protein phosphatase [Pseudomonadota bacterium]|nr:SpoIIE family protein phosphatase [Pseudomonadota bacterium]